MLIGRGAERALLDRLLDDARSGVSNCVLVRGEPGIGKTTLLRDTQDRARARGFTVLTAAGVEAESQIPYAALSELFLPSHRKSETFIPGLTSGEPATAPGHGRDVQPAASGGDRLTVAAATLQELALAAEERPVLCVVDDAQWIDPSSAEALVFTARRLAAEGILILLGVRSSEPGAARFEAAPSHTITLEGLDADAARELLTRADRTSLHPDVLDQVFATADGNPLALLELPAALSAEQRAGRLPVHSPLPLGPLLERAFARRIHKLPTSTQRALRVVAANDLPLPIVVVGALARGDVSLADLNAAEDDGLIHIKPTGVDFRHPLMRSAAYQSATESQRREAHLWLAETLADLTKVVSQASDRRVWHLLAATVSPDDLVADELATAATKAAAVRSYAIASTLYEHAALLTVDPVTRPSRLFQAGLASIPAGRGEESIRLFREALEQTQAPRERVRIEHHICQLQLWRHAPLAARDRLMELASETEQTDRELAATIVASAAQASIVMYDQPGIAAAARVAGDLADGEPRLVLAAAVIHAFAETQAGRGDEAAKILDQCKPALLTEEPLAVDQLVLQAGVCNLALERFLEARELLLYAVTKARRFAASGTLSMQLPWLALLDLADGRWVSALAEANEAVRLIEEIGWDTYRPMGLSVLARVEAGMGRPESVEHARGASEAARAIGALPLAAHAHAALGLYHLGTKSWAAAADELEETLRLAGAGAPPLLRVQFLPDAVEACARAARTARANELLDELDSTAAMMGRASTLALAARCRGLLAPNDSEEHFVQSLAHSGRQQGGSAFERARTALYYGEVLRRAKRRSEAREQFAQAHEQFQKLEATPWAERAARWLGPGAPRGHQSALALTSQEVQVAVAVAGGMTNAQVAASLFLSVKTVEYHLGHVYQKLGIRSRSQLAPRLPEIDPSIELARQPGGALVRS